MNCTILNGHKVGRIFLLMLGSSLLLSCAPNINVDDQLNLVAIPAAWQSPDMTAVRSELNWLNADEVRDLPEIVFKALENNPDLRVSANRLRTALAQQSITDGARSITGDIRVGATRSGDFERGTADNQSFSLRGALGVGLQAIAPLQNSRFFPSKMILNLRACRLQQERLNVGLM